MLQRQALLSTIQVFQAPHKAGNFLCIRAANSFCCLDVVNGTFLPHSDLEGWFSCRLWNVHKNEEQSTLWMLRTSPNNINSLTPPTSLVSLRENYRNLQQYAVSGLRHRRKPISFFFVSMNIQTQPRGSLKCKPAPALLWPQAIMKSNDTLWCVIKSKLAVSMN
jgi:hypothetical protein